MSDAVKKCSSSNESRDGRQDLGSAQIENVHSVLDVGKLNLVGGYSKMASLDGEPCAR
jgi:hypothetical protein